LDETPKNCPSTDGALEGVRELYEDEMNKKLAVCAAQTEAGGYCEQTRLEEIMGFAERCGFKKLGVAFCAGFKKEAEILTRVLTHNGFTVDSAVCKNGSIPKEELGLSDSEKVRPGTYEPMCNPIGQAMILNRAGTALNLILGLCGGHDSLCIKYSEAPVTVFARRTGCSRTTRWVLYIWRTAIIRTSCLIGKKKIKLRRRELSGKQDVAPVQQTVEDRRREVGIEPPV
jgi:uncharacterized metal-binding protein